MKHETDQEASALAASRRKRLFDLLRQEALNTAATVTPPRSEAADAEDFMKSAMASIRAR